MEPSAFLKKKYHYFFFIFKRTIMPLRMPGAVFPFSLSPVHAPYLSPPQQRRSPPSDPGERQPSTFPPPSLPFEFHPLQRRWPAPFPASDLSGTAMIDARAIQGRGRGGGGGGRSGGDSKLSTRACRRSRLSWSWGTQLQRVAASTYLP